MDKDMHQGHEPKHVDLTQLEGAPSPRSDPLLERQTDDTELASRWFRVRFYSDGPVHSPAGTATALLRLILAAGLPAGGVVAAGWTMGMAAGLTLALAALLFVMVGGVGLFLILRNAPDAPAHRDISSGDRRKQGDARTDLRLAERDGTGKWHSRDPATPPTRTRLHRALQPPRRR